MEFREFKIRSVNEDERTVEGIAIPYDVTIDLPREGIKERVRRGAFGTPESVPLYFEHSWFRSGDPRNIGEVYFFDETDEGLAVKARFNNSAKADEVYAQALRGQLDRLSAAFTPIEDVVEGDVVVRTKADLLEVSIVQKPAYEGAKVTQVRDNQNNEEEVIELTTNEVTSEAVATQLRERDERIDDLERKIAGFSVEDAGNTEGSKFRSAGEFLKALETGDESAKAEIRAYTGATSADSHTGNDWKADVLRIVDRGRPVLNLFSRGPLGATGNTVEYPKVSGITGDVAVQAAEGDDLAYVEVAITTATAAVKTYGGYSQLTRQAIERSDVSYLDAVLRAQAASYAKVTNAAVRTAMTAATPQTGTSFTLSTAKGKDFIGAVVDGVNKIDANGNGAAADFVLVGTDVYVAMATLADSTDRPLFNINGDGSNTPGNINVRGIAGSIAGLTLVVDPGLAVKTLYVASSEAVMSWENAGAPLRLEDENIINLSKDFSLYGYMAVGVKNANGLVKPTIA
jgi:hypothetical protein